MEVYPFPNRSRQGTLPKLTAKSNCRYEVEWVTEYACHRDYLESGNCSLSSAQHDIAVDLGPLRQTRGELRGAAGRGGRRGGGGSDSRSDSRPRPRPGLCSRAPFSPGHYYTADGKEYIFYLNVCGEVEAAPKACNEKQAAVCQAKKPDFTQVRVAGKFQSQTLRCVNSLPALSPAHCVPSCKTRPASGGPPPPREAGGRGHGPGSPGTAALPGWTMRGPRHSCLLYEPLSAGAAP